VVRFIVVFDIGTGLDNVSLGSRFCYGRGLRAVGAGGLSGGRFA